MRHFLLAILLVLVFFAGPSSAKPTTCATYTGTPGGDGYKAGDLRLTPADSYAAGTVAAAGDSDLADTFLGNSDLKCAPWKLRFKDSNGDDKFGAKEKVLHIVNGNKTGILGVRILPTAGFGQQVEPGDSDYNHAKKNLKARACRIENAPGSRDDEFYLSFKKSGKMPAKGDVRLTASGTNPAGTRLGAALDTPFTLCVPLQDHLKHADANGNHRYDADDTTILDFPNALPGNLTVHFVDIGQGQGIVLRFPDAFVVLDAANRFASQAAFLDYIAGLGATRIDHLIITNPDADHAAACNELFQLYPVSHFYHPGNVKDTETWNECLDNATAEPGLVTHTDTNMDPGDLLAISQYATVRLLNVDAASSSINRGSLALRIDYGQTSWIFAGDMDCTAEDTTIARGYDLDADLLQVGHHGSKTSSCDPWLQAITPQAAFISVGAGNSFHHPTTEALQRLANVGATVFRTDLDGTIVIDTDGATWDVR